MIIAIDGFSGCGKSTLAKALAKIYNLPYIDTGAMYRAVTFAVLKENIFITDTSRLEQLLSDINIHFERIDGNNHIFLNGRDIDSEIRSGEISAMVSEVSAVPSVRNLMVSMQRNMDGTGLVMDGRDIGTVVFPNAEFKFFLTADLDIRALRRFNELKEKGLSQSLEEVKENLIHRDHLDSTRSHSPLRKADDAITIDNSYLSFDELVAVVKGFIDR